MNFSNSSEIFENHIKVSECFTSLTPRVARWMPQFGLGIVSFANNFPKFSYTVGLVPTLMFPIIEGGTFRKSKLADWVSLSMPVSLPK